MFNYTKLEKNVKIFYFYFILQYPVEKLEKKSKYFLDFILQYPFFNHCLY